MEKMQGRQGELPYVRHETAPHVMGCRWCGFPESNHYHRYVPSRGYHEWEQPTQSQVEARWAARRRLRSVEVLLNHE